MRQFLKSENLSATAAPSEGTPKTMRQAIINGIKDGFKKENAGKPLADAVEAHVRDFLAQKFSVEILSARTAEADLLEALFEEITRK